MADELLGPKFRDAGARRRVRRPPDPVTLEWLRKECAHEERILRMQFPEDRLPDEVEARLAHYKPLDSTASGLGCWAYLRHQWTVWREGLRAAQDGEVDGRAYEAMRQLLRSEPVILEVVGHRVEITDRSFNALALIAQHDLAITQLRSDVARITELAARVRDRPGRLNRFRHRRRYRKLRDLAAVAWEELTHHRSWLWAHAIVPGGGPAPDDYMLPDWWEHTTLEDDAVLAQALWEVGPGRVRALGPAPRRKEREDGRRQVVEQWGFSSIVAAFEPRMHLEPAAAFDIPAGRMLAHMRASQDPIPADELEG